MLQKYIVGILIAFSVIGLGLSIYSTYTHYDDNVHEICSINEKFDCDIVNKSKYAKFLGVPVAIYGVLGYVVILASVITYLKKEESRAMILDGLAAVTGIGFLFSLYLTYIEAYVLFSWCIICIGSAISMTIVMLATLILRKEQKKHLV